jgi:ATP-dependent Clp protease ATP-binding subunit ClpA
MQLILCCSLPAVGAGNTEGGLDFANMLKPALARSALQVIGATTLDEYRQHIETDPALNRRFQVR